MAHIVENGNTIEVYNGTKPVKSFSMNEYAEAQKLVKNLREASSGRFIPPNTGKKRPCTLSLVEKKKAILSQSSSGYYHGRRVDKMSNGEILAIYRNCFEK